MCIHSLTRDEVHRIAAWGKHCISDLYPQTARIALLLPPTFSSSPVRQQIYSGLPLQYRSSAQPGKQEESPGSQGPIQSTVLALDPPLSPELRIRHQFTPLTFHFDLPSSSPHVLFVLLLSANALCPVPSIYRLLTPEALLSILVLKCLSSPFVP